MHNRIVHTNNIREHERNTRVFRGFLTDFLTATDTNNTASKSEKNEVIKSVALRALGALVLLTSGASFVMAGILINIYIEKNRM